MMPNSQCISTRSATPKTDTEVFAPLQQRQAFAVSLTGFQMAMSNLMEIIYGGVLEDYPNIKVVIGDRALAGFPIFWSTWI